MYDILVAFILAPKACVSYRMYGCDIICYSVHIATDSDGIDKKFIGGYGNSQVVPIESTEVVTRLLRYWF